MNKHIEVSLSCLEGHLVMQSHLNYNFIFRFSLKRVDINSLVSVMNLSVNKKPNDNHDI